MNKEFLLFDIFKQKRKKKSLHVVSFRLSVSRESLQIIILFLKKSFQAARKYINFL